MASPFNMEKIRAALSKKKCYMCGKESDWYCEQCGEIVCEECTVPFTQFNQLTETRCVECYDGKVI